MTWNSRWIAMLLAALLTGALLGSSLAVSAAAAEDETATAAVAASKCKKLKGKAKRKCYKKLIQQLGGPPSGGAAPAPAATGTTPTVTPPPPGETSRQRLSLTWSGTGTDLDLYVWDEFGNRADYIGNAIPASTHSGSVSFNGPETFTDLSPPFNRAFSVGVCVYSAPANPATIPWTLVYRGWSGTTFTFNNTVSSTPGSAGIYQTTGEFGPYNPGTGWCNHV